MNNFLSRILVALACCLLPLTAQAQVDKAEIRKHIAEHKKWMAAHTPNPKSLSDSALIIETTRAIYTTCHEPQVVAMIRFAGQKYGSRELVEYAGMRERQDYDLDNQMAVKCLEQLSEQAQRLFGKASYPEAFVCLRRLMVNDTKKDRYPFAKKLETIAEELLKTEPTDANHEMALMARECSLFYQGYEWENPNVYEGMQLLTIDIFDFYKRTGHRSDVQVELLSIWYAYYKNLHLYENYYVYVNQSLLRKGLIAETESWIPQDLGLTEDEIKPQKVILEIYRRVLHPWHPDVLLMEASNIGLHGETPEESLQRLRVIQTFLQEYDDRRHKSSWEVNQQIRIMQIMQQQEVTDTTLMDDLETMEQCLSPSNITYFYVMSSALFYEAYRPTGHLANLVDKMDEKVKAYAGDDKIMELSLSEYKGTLQRMAAPGHEYDYYELAQEFLDCCDEYPNWKTISLGKNLAKQFSVMWNDAATALTLQRRTTALLRKMVGDKNPIFVMEYLRYAQMVRDYPSRVASTLDGKQGADSLFLDLIQCAPAANVVQNAMICAGQYFCNKNEMKLGRSYLNQALQLLTERKGQDPTEDSLMADRNRYDLSTIYQSLFYSYSSQFMTPEYQADSMVYYGQILEKQVEGIEFNPSLNWSLFNSLSDYYIKTQQLQKNKELLERCLSYYDQIVGNRVDGYYLQIITQLINIAKYIDNNMDLCHELAERLERDLKGFENMGNYENHITLLRTLYDLIEEKNPYDLILLNRYYSMLDKAVNDYWEASRHRDDVWFEHGLYLAIKQLSIASKHDQIRNMVIANGGDVEADAKGWEVMKENIITHIVPELQRRREQLEEMNRNAQQMPQTYYQILMCQATAAEFCLEDMELAEKYYRELAEGAGIDGLSLLGKFLILKDRADEAVPVYEKIEAILHDSDRIDMQIPMSNLMGKANIVAGIFIAYYMAGRYEDALRMAHEFQGYINAYIQQNFDFMTQNEREAFLMGNSTGNLPLLKLVSVMPERLSGEAYDAALRDKGLLLRTTNRLQRAIENSGNDTLIHAVDSLRMMQQQLSAIQNNSPNAQQQFASLRDQMERLERYIARKSAVYKTEQEAIATWQQVRDKLKKDEVAVEYVMTDSILMALVVTPNCQMPQYVQVLEVSEGGKLLNLITQNNPTQVAHILYGPGNTLAYDLFWKPLEPHFKGARKIYYSPTGVLNSLAFAAFTLPDNSYLIDHYELHQLTTTARIAYRDKRKKSKKRELTAQVYGAFYYNEEQRDYYEPRLTALRHSFQDNTFLAQNDKQRGVAEEFPFLENSLHEVDAVEALLSQNNVRVNKQIGAEPTELAIREMDGKSPDILLISTHGFFYNDVKKAVKVPYLNRRKSTLNAMTSTGLILADGERSWQGEVQTGEIDDDRDNILSSDEVATMDLTGTQLAILSACETGLGSTTMMEGVYGLQRGFKQAGVSSLCASLWSVDDLSTAAIIQSFFQHWLKGKKGMTMQKAMIEAMKEQRNRTPEPYFWAPFVLYDAED